MEGYKIGLYSGKREIFIIEEGGDGYEMNISCSLRVYTLVYPSIYLSELLTTLVRAGASKPSDLNKIYSLLIIFLFGSPGYLDSRK